MEILRRSIQGQVRKLVGSRQRDAGLPGPGLFPPGSACRKVHGDFTTMMIGGSSALLLQMLHPHALAGVWDHSNFQNDVLGRLRRTAQFISGTTFGSTETAMAMIRQVRTIHDRVQGTLPDGTPYSANDPDVLTWVHIAGASSFLRSYIRYRDPDFSRDDQDRYFTETAEVARLLGAENVPVTVAEVEDYLQAMRPALRADHRAREIAGALLNQKPPSLALLPFQRLVLTAGIDLLPEWAARMHGLSVPSIGRPAVRASTRGIGAVMRWALHG